MPPSPIPKNTRTLKILLIMNSHLIWHLWSMHHWAWRSRNLNGIAVFLVQQSFEFDLKKAQLPPWTLSNNTISFLYIYHELPQWANHIPQPAHWRVHFYVDFLCFWKISVAGCVVFDNQECRLYSAQSPKMSFFWRSISAKSKSEPVILL